MKKYTIYGNCQGQAISTILNQCNNFTKVYEYVKIKKVHELNSIELEKVLEEVIPQIDLLIYQPVSENFKNNRKYSSKNFVSYLKQDAIALSFPSCYFQGYHPELRRIQDHTGKRINISLQFNSKVLKPIFVHDVNIIRAYLEGKTVEEIFDNFFNPSFYSLEFSQENVLLTLSNLKVKEEQNNVDIIISDFISNNFQAQRLFSTFNHPTAVLLKYIAECILNKLSIQPNLPNHLKNALDRAVFPVYTATYNNLGLQFDSEIQHRILSSKIELKSLIEQYLNFYQTIPRSILVDNCDNKILTMATVEGDK